MMRKPGLLIGCAAGALLAAQASPAAAQSFQGTPTVVTGSATVSTGPTTTNIFLNTTETVINWTTEDVAASGAIDFQPVGTTATFENGPSGTDYTVLNRILPVDGGGLPVTATVSFNGTVNSLIVNDIGGHIWFYSPTGIIAGPTARFNVGSLILTTNDIAFIPNPVGGFGSIYGPGGLVQFTGPAGSSGFVEVQDGAQLSATGVNAYVALVAPRVIQGGLVQADGQVAYIAAEQLDMTINGGLFDFVLTVGTEDANGVVHTGTTTGPASTSIADPQRIAMVALPKNDALTMLLSGSIGYTPAASAANEGSSVVLAASFDSAAPLADPGNRLGSISIGDATFRNALTGYASDDVTIAPAGGTTSFEDVATFHALDDLSVIAESGERVEALVDLVLNAGEPGTGGDILVEAQDTGAIDVTRQFAASAGSSAFYGTAPGDAQGGTVTMTADGGTITALEAFIDASAFGGIGGAPGGTATGGTIGLTAANGGAMTFTNFVSVNADAGGGSFSTNGSAATGGTVGVSVTNGTITTGSFSSSAGGFGGFGATSGGDGFGGTISLVENDGQLALGFVSLAANGAGSFSGGQGGNGTGGQIAIALNDQAQAWDELFASAVASAGAGGTGSGRATGLADAISLTLTGPSSLTIANSATLDADARAAPNTALGINSEAGGVMLTIDQGAALTVGGTIEAHANILFGVEGPPVGSTTTPDVQAGTVSIVSRGSIAAAGLTATANATGASADTRAGTATGGTVSVTAADGGSIGIDDGASGGEFTLLANASGMTGPMPSHAQGGTAQLIADGGSIAALGAATVEAGAQMPLFLTPDGPGFDATGGTASVELRESAIGTSAISVGTLDVRALGDARPMQFDFILGTGVPAPVVGDGGTGRGGTVSVTQAAGTLTAARLTLDAAGFGASSTASAGPAAFQSGDGFGGNAMLAQSGGTATVATLELLGNGVGGGGIAPAATASELAALAGDGTGGNATLSISGGTLGANATTIAALGIGAAGMDHNGGSGAASDGGTGTGGTAQLQSPDGSTGSFTTAALAIRGNGTGGTGGNAPDGTIGDGGNGVGGTASTALADGAFSLGAVAIEANGLGGNGALGGEGSGGQAQFGLADSAAGPSGARDLASLTIEASGDGGIGDGGDAAESDAGRAGWAIAVRDADAALGFTGSLTATSLGSRVPAGAGVTGSNAGAALAVGGDIVVDTSGAIAIDAFEPIDAGARVDMAGQSFASTGQISSGTTMSIVAADGITASGRLASGATTLLRAVDGPIAVDLDSVDAVTALARSVTIVSPGALAFADLDATAGTLSVETAGDLAVTTADATGAVTLSSTGGAIRATANVNGASIALTAGGGVRADADLTAAGALAVEAGGAFTLAGTGRGTTVTVTSADIALGNAAALGVRGTTTSLTLVNGDPGRITAIGGAARAGTYSLDADEATRLFADEAISLGVGPGALEPDEGVVEIGDLAMAFGASGNLGAGGQLEISTPTRIFIAGDVALETVSADDSFLLDPTLIELATDSGSIAMLDDGGDPLGRLSMIGDMIAIAGSDTLGVLRSATDFDAINDALDQPAGTGQPLRAGTVTLSVVDGLYIQNTGASDAYDDRRGFAAATVEIATESADTRIAINGQILTAGGPVGGLDTEPLVTINGAPAAAGGQFDPGSTINGCVIGSDCRVGPPPPPPPPPEERPGEPPPRDDLDPLPETSPPALFAGQLIELTESDPLVEPPLVDEPITGIGNDDLWEPRCEPGDDGCRETEGQP